MSVRPLTDSEAFQRYLAKQLANGGRHRRPEELLRAWRSRRKSRSGGKGKRTKPHENARDSAPPLRSESELGRTLREIRDRYIAEGGKLLSIEEIDREVAERRGEHSL